jgi:hypothetical protein
MNDRLAQAKELAKEAIEEKYGEIDHFVESWVIHDTRPMLGYDGFEILYETRREGRHGAVISVRDEEMNVELVF